jgi:hypothetical protein
MSKKNKKTLRSYLINLSAWVKSNDPIIKEKYLEFEVDYNFIGKTLNINNLDSKKIKEEADKKTIRGFWFQAWEEVVAPSASDRASSIPSSSPAFPLQSQIIQKTIGIQLYFVNDVFCFLIKQLSLNEEAKISLFSQKKAELVFNLFQGLRKIKVNLPLISNRDFDVTNYNWFPLEYPENAKLKTSCIYKDKEYIIISLARQCVIESPRTKKRLIVDFSLLRFKYMER